MSAFMVSAKHIAALVDAAIATNLIDFEKRGEKCEMLAAENTASIRYRYPTSKEEIGHTFPKVPEMAVRLGVVPVLKLIDCYEYQSCEHGAWNDSDAKRFCDQLRDRLISKLPGYDDAPWGL